jgi:nucleotidyltransferase substrate binding protein (TIGR01987 family)
MGQDVRWIQRFSNYNKAFQQLQEAVDLSKTRPLSKLEKQGLIQCFEYTHELAWKTLKDFLESRGGSELFGSKDVTRQAFQLGLIANGNVWMNMIKSRNQTSHIYDEKAVEEIISLILIEYFFEFQSLLGSLNKLKSKKEIL